MNFADVLVGEGLVEAVQSAVQDKTWVEKNFAQRRRDEVLNDSWDAFCQAVKHETRYVLWLRKDRDDEDEAWTGEITPARILVEIGRLINQLELVSPLPVGHRLWRAHTHGPEGIEHTAARLGTATQEHAKQANRMSPAGIPMFYGAEDKSTAVAEVAVRTEDGWATIGEFETTAECFVVDFTQLPPIPSIFDREWGGMRRYLLFLHRFRDQLSEPAREKYEQIDYVPTQIVTEYLLRVFDGGDAIRGLRYGSATTKQVCVVLDVPHDRCIDSDAEPVSHGEVYLRLLEGVTTEQLSASLS